MALWTDRGLLRLKELFFFGTWNGGSAPSTFKMVALASTSPVPDKDTQTIGGDSLVEIPAGNGYTSGGVNVARSLVGFDATALASHILTTTLKNVVYLADGGLLPSSGYMRYVVLTDDNATLNSREVLAIFDIGENTNTADGQAITLEDGTLRLRNDL